MKTLSSAFVLSYNEQVVTLS